MNCKQVQKFLPLYVGHDLSSRRDHSIAAHLESCATCAKALGEYQTARDLMQDFATPVFSDDVYADIRASVWRRVESESRPSILAAMSAWFQPRLVWTGTAVLLFAVSAVAIYVATERLTVKPKVIAELPETVLRRYGQGQNGGTNNSNPEKPRRPRQADMPKRRQQSARTVAPDRAVGANAYSPDIQATRVESSPPIIGADNVDLGSGSASGSLRMELQTKDPNIRIIWFTQSESKPAAPF